jgi:hypothetical protein
VTDDRRDRGWLRATGAVARRPRLWPTAVSSAIALVPNRWWRRRPFLPIPDRNWLRFRMVTAYGGDGGSPDPADVITWLEWRRNTPSPGRR